MSLFKNNKIRNRVLSVMEQRISFAQKEYDEKATEIDENTAESIRVITNQAVTKKEEIETDLVLKLIGDKI